MSFPKNKVPTRPTGPSLPFLLFTLGDPAGVGPAVAVAAARNPRVRRQCRPVLVGDAWIVQRYSPLRLRVHPIVSLDEYRSPRADGITVLHVPHPAIRTIELGRPQKTGGEAAVMAVRAAVALVLEKRATALVTGPVSKVALQMAHFSHTGHTELLADLCDTPNVEMLMTAGALRTVLVTRHIPLMKVADRLTPKKITDAVRRTDPWLKKVLALRRPIRWAVCGLNPHAGDHGLLGSEDRTTVRTAVATLTRSGFDMIGPWPADTVWAQHAAGRFDAVVSLYHDQGMIPLKTLCPNAVVNTTVGLPFVRTSPGHGTAYDLADDATPYRRADPTATIEAALWALQAARKLAR